MPQGSAVIANVAAQHCNRNDIARHGDNPVTGGLQKHVHNDLWEHHMLAKGSSGSANRLVRLYDVPVGDLNVMDGNLSRTRRPGPAEVRLPPAVTELTDGDDAKAGFWPSVTKFLIEGLALCAVAMHPAILYPLEPHLEERKMPEQGEMWWRKRQGLIALVPKPASQHAVSLEVERATRQAAFEGDTAAFAGGNPNELEREIERAVAALAKLDDRTLRDLGIADRSQIEPTVRYCHDC